MVEIKLPLVWIIWLYQKMGNYRSKAYLLFTTLLLSVLSCGAPFTDTPFHILAAYQAASSGYQVIIDAQGIVPAGSDICEDGAAQVLISPISKHGRLLKIEISAQGSAAVSVGSESARPIHWDKGAQNELTVRLEAAGYRNLFSEEVAETIRVIEGARSGPKGMILGGQTAILEVIEVTNKR